MATSHSDAFLGFLFAWLAGFVALISVLLWWVS